MGVVTCFYFNQIPFCFLIESAIDRDDSYKNLFFGCVASQCSVISPEMLYIRFHCRILDLNRNNPYGFH